MSVGTMERGWQLSAYPTENLEVLVEHVLRRATTRAAMAAAYARGRNNRHFADELAVSAMRDELNNTLPVGAEVVIGEGERDEAPMLFIGERLGPNQDQPPELLIAVDPLEATNNCARWMPGSICVIAGALVGQGDLWRGIDGYMDKFVVGRQLAVGVEELRCGRTHLRTLDFDRKAFLLDQPIEKLVRVFSMLTGKPSSSLVAEMLDRPRNADCIKRLRQMHVQVRLITDGDVASAWRALDEDHEVDFTIGIGAAPEGVLAAAMTNVMGGYMEGRCWFDDTEKGVEQKRRFLDLGVSISKVHTIADLASNNVVIAFTAVTDGVMPGVSYRAGNVVQTHSIVGRSRTGTYHKLTGMHRSPPSPPRNWPTTEDE